MIRRASVITDCFCANAALRQSLAWSTLAKTDQPTITPIHGDVDGSGMLVDALVETRGEKWVVFCQSAPRDRSKGDGSNGAKFGYFWKDQTLVLASLDGFMLSLSSRVGLMTSEMAIYSLDIPEVLGFAVAERLLSGEASASICRSQFRSLKFAPRAVRWILDGVKIPSSPFPFSQIPEFGIRVWFVDNFGNCKTSLRVSDVEFREGKILHTSLGDFPCFRDLRSVPAGQHAAIVGSSGLEGDEFIELVVQGVGSGSAAKRFGLSVGAIFELK